MRRFYQLLGFGVFFVASVYFVSFAVKHATDLSKISWDFKSLISFCGAIGLATFSIFLGGLAWHLLLNALSEPSRLGRTLTIYSIAQFAKYIPGNIVHHIGRVGLARAYGFKLSAIIFTMAIEVAWVLVSACTFALISLLLIGDRLFANVPSLPQTWQLAFAAVTAFFIPFAGHRIFAFWQRHKAYNPIEADSIRTPRTSVFINCFLIYSLNFFSMGLIIHILAKSLFGAGEGQFLVLSAIFVVAWTAGFLAPGAPAGLGVREAILLAALSHIYSPGVTLGLALSLRLVTTMADGFAFILAVIARNKFFPIPTKQSPTMAGQRET